MKEECAHKNCTRWATMSNNEYFNGIWYCTFHGNKKVREGRIKKKIAKKNRPSSK